MSKARAPQVRKEDSRRMEDDARRMEMKLDMLRKTMESSEAPAAQKKDPSGSRWKSGRTDVPIRGYVDKAGKDATRKKASSSGAPSGGSTGQRPGSNGSSRSAGGQAPQPAPVFGDLLSASAPQHTAGAGASPGGGGRAASNIQAALQLQGNDVAEVEAFLAGLGLDRYNALFIEHGFDCMDVVHDMQESHMKEIGMATGHIIKLRKKLAEINPAPAPSASAKRVSFGGAEAQARPAAKTSDGGVGTQGGSLLDGEFNEAANAEAFKDAVRAWREAGKEPAPAAKAGSSFWSSVGGDQVDLVRASTPLLETPGAAEADASAGSDVPVVHDAAPGDEKLCCFQCYKQFFAKFAVERPNPLGEGGMKRMCSEACAARWEAAAATRAEELERRKAKVEKMHELQRTLAEEQRLANEASANSSVGPAAVAA